MLLKNNNREIKLCKDGSILDLLKDQLNETEIFDLLSKFNIEDLLNGGDKLTDKMSISIIIESEPEKESKKETKTISIGDKEYDVEVVTSAKDMEKGLGDRDSLSKDCGMLFDFKTVREEVTFNCYEMKFPIDIIFINDDNKVIRVAENCKPGKDLFTENNVRYVLEVNKKSGIQEGDELEDIEENDSVMKVLSPDGSTQMELWGGERIFSRKNTKVLIHQAKKAELSNSDSDYKRLGKSIFKFLDVLESNTPEYVEAPD